MDPTHPSNARPLREVVLPGPFPVLVHPGWGTEHPWLVQGITAVGSRDDPCDLALFTAAPGHEVQHRWEVFRSAVGLPTAVHGRQIHGATVRHHRSVDPGLHLSEACDGHITRAVGVLLTVAVADCVPITLVDANARLVAVLHAGWRGIAAGVLESGLSAYRRRFDRPPSGLEAHLGPSICGRCYEVGPEVHVALGEPEPAHARPLDLRRVLADRLMRAGVESGRVTSSEWCTRCGDSPFFSHRGGDTGRQVAFVGIRG